MIQQREQVNPSLWTMISAKEKRAHYENLSNNKNTFLNLSDELSQKF